MIEKLKQSWRNREEWSTEKARFMLGLLILGVLLPGIVIEWLLQLRTPYPLVAFWIWIRVALKDDSPE